MGIHGISHLVKQYLAATTQTIILPNSRILIDGAGFCFHLLNNTSPSLNDSSPNETTGPLSRHHNGDYTHLAHRVQQYITYLRDHCNLIPEVYWDGKSKLKQKTHDSRKKQRIQCLKRHQLYCEEGIKTNQDDLPPPPLFTIQVRHTLTEMNVRQVRCEYEADPDMAQDSSLTGSYILANDSDFLFFQGCKYISFESGIQCIQNENGNGTTTLKACILTRAGFAEHFQTNEHTLVEWGLFLGNDFTGPLVRNHRKRKKTSSQQDDDDDNNQNNTSLFILCGLDGITDVTTPLPNREEYEKSGDPESLLDEFFGLFERAETKEKYWLKSVTGDLLNDPLETALLFSRAYYNHGDMSGFEDDEPSERKSNRNENEDDDDERGIPFFINLVPSNDASIGSIVLEALLTEDNFDDVHYDAIIGIMAGERYYYDDDTHGAMHDVHLKYDDVTFAYKYQKSCRRLMSVIRNQWASNETMMHEIVLTNPENSPSKLFHGPTFHILCKKQRELVAAELAATNLNDLEIEMNDCTLDDNENETKTQRDTLPIDDHKDRILQHIATHQVTIIQGETGCGKSSRIPVLLLEDVNNNQKYRLKMFVSQPRRIAATTLKKRVAEVLGKRVGLRLGNGIREETKDTQVWYCTAGYLSRLAAHHPEAFATHTHLIIDEIHERSVDTDLLCYMTRRLLDMHPHLKLIVMSATLNTTTYASYFGIPDNEYLFVGARRFPLEINWLDEMSKMNSVLSKPLMNACKKLSNQRVDVSQNFSKAQVDIAFDLCRQVGTPGRSVLIFVSGIAQITDIVERFTEIQDRRGRSNYIIIPIHSDIPFEEQMTAFDASVGEEDVELPIKIVVATNAAESSITLPDCDNVICLGTAKRVEYNPKFHRIQLVHRFISKAGCDQRAGRTGRVRPGKVWRLYTKKCFIAMDEFDPPEIQQTPLEHVIIQLKTALNTNIIPVLENVISPPDLRHIQPSFNELFRMRFIEHASDAADLTEDGRIAAALGLDLKISQVVLYGIKLGVPQEAVAMAAALSMDKTPFRMASPFVHSPEEMIDIVNYVCCGLNFFDNGMYSTPMMLVRLLHWYRYGAGKSDKGRNMKRYGLAHSRTKRLHTICRGIEMKMAKFVGNFLKRDIVDIAEHPRILNLLRIILVWSFYPNIFKMSTSKLNKLPNHVALTVRGDPINNNIISNLLGEEQNSSSSWSLTGVGTVQYVPTFGDSTNISASEWCTFIVDPIFASCRLMRLETTDTEPTIFFCSDNDNDNAVLKSIFGSPSAENIQINGRLFNSYSFTKLSKSQKKRLKEVEDRLLCTVHVRDEGMNRSKFIKVKNVPMDEQFLHEYFDELIGLSMSRSQGKPKIQFQVKPLLKRVEEEQPNDRDGETKSSQAVLPAGLPVVPPLIDDIPFEMRKLLMLASFDRRGCINFPTSKPIVVGDGGNVGKNMKYDQIRLNSPFRTTTEFIVSDSNPSSNYDSDSDDNFGGRNKGVRTLMERASLVSVSHHMSINKKEVETFGIAGGVMAIGEDASTMVLQQCSLTAPGRDFIHRALLCIREGFRVELDRHDSPLTLLEQELVLKISNELRGSTDESNGRTWHEYIQCELWEEPTEEIEDISDIEDEDVYYFNTITGQFIFGAIEIEDDNIDFKGTRSSQDVEYFRNLILQSNAQLRRDEENDDHDTLIGRLEKLFQLDQARPFATKKNAPTKSVDNKKSKRLKKQMKMAKKLQPAQLHLLAKPSKPKKKAKRNRNNEKKKDKFLQDEQTKKDKQRKKSIKTKQEINTPKEIPGEMDNQQVKELEEKIQQQKIKMVHNYLKRREGGICRYSLLRSAYPDFNRTLLESLNFVIQAHPLGNVSDIWCSLPEYDWEKNIPADVKKWIKKIKKKAKKAKKTMKVKQVGETKAVPVTGETKEEARKSTREKTTERFRVKAGLTPQKEELQPMEAPSPIQNIPPLMEIISPLQLKPTRRKTSYKYRCLECNSRFDSWVLCSNHLTESGHLKDMCSSELEFQQFCVHPLLRGDELL